MGVKSHPPLTAPATPLARQWAGYGTALKPAWEPAILARKPLDGTVAQNDAIVQEGPGGLRLEGGFWHASLIAPPSDRIFANGFDATQPINGGAQHRH